MQIYIKNMVCPRCITAVKEILVQSGIHAISVQLGEVAIAKTPTTQELTNLRVKLTALGFELLDDDKKQVIEKIKTTIIEQVHYAANDKKHRLSDILSKKLLKDYSFLSNLFSEVEGITIEKYLINQKIEKAKELLVYNQLTLSEISFQLGYSSVAHLSAQFKTVTGLTPTHFKKSGAVQRKTIDKI